MSLTRALPNPLIFRPVLPKAENRVLAQQTPMDPMPNLPHWEQHPQGRNGQGAGQMDTDWIRRHLP
jgi:hypothetical protein